MSHVQSQWGKRGAAFRLTSAKVFTHRTPAKPLTVTRSARPAHFRHASDCTPSSFMSATARGQGCRPSPNAGTNLEPQTLMRAAELGPPEVLGASSARELSLDDCLILLSRQRRVSAVTLAKVSTFTVAHTGKDPRVSTHATSGGFGVQEFRISTPRTSYSGSLLWTVLTPKALKFPALISSPNSLNGLSAQQEATVRDPSCNQFYWCSPSSRTNHLSRSRPSKANPCPDQ